MADESTEATWAQIPPMDPVQHVIRVSNPPEGWYADPWAVNLLRWWDGNQWTSYMSATSPPIERAHQIGPPLDVVAPSAGGSDTPTPGSASSSKRNRRQRWAGTPALLILAAVAALSVMGFMTVKTYRTDQRIAVLLHRGVGVTYTVSTCQTDESDDLSSGDLTCSGGFSYRGQYYEENISGLLKSAGNGQAVSAMIDPTNPSSYVYARSAVIGPNAAGRGAWYTGLVVVFALAIGMVILALSPIARDHRSGPKVDRG